MKYQDDMMTFSMFSELSGTWISKHNIIQFYQANCCCHYYVKSSSHTHIVANTAEDLSPEVGQLYSNTCCSSLIKLFNMYHDRRPTAAP